MSRLCRAVVLASVVVMAACSSGESSDGGGSSTTVDEASAEAAIGDAAGGYLAAIADGDFKRANDLRCTPERLDEDDLSPFESASEALLEELDGLEVSATDAAIGTDGRGLAVMTVEPSEVDVVLVLEEEMPGTWRVCGQITREADNARSILNEQPQEPLRAEVSMKDVLRYIDIEGYELGRSDVPSSEPDDAERGILRRESTLFTGSPGSPDVRVVVTELEDGEAAAVEELHQGRGLIENSIAVLDVDGEHDRGVRYLASFKTFIQPSMLGPYWDAVWLLVDDYLVLVSVGPIDSADAHSIAEDVANSLVEQLAAA